jgi:hypothetical protein
MRQKARQKATVKQKLAVKLQKLASKMPLLTESAQKMHSLSPKE